MKWVTRLFQLFQMSPQLLSLVLLPVEFDGVVLLCSVLSARITLFRARLIVSQVGG